MKNKGKVLSVALAGMMLLAGCGSKEKAGGSEKARSG